MTVLADFLDDLLRGFGVVAWSLAIGGLVWALVVLRGWRRLMAPAAEVLRAGLGLVALGAGGIGIAALSQVAIKALILRETLDSPPLPAFLATPFCRAEGLQAALAAALAIATLWLRAAPASPPRWGVVVAGGLALVVNGAWLVHAASRLEGRGALMALTVLHQVGGGAWAGGLAQLLLVWRRVRRRPELAVLWPLVLRRFALVAVPAVALLAGTGLALGRIYVATWSGLFGTPYGAIIVTKIVLFAAAAGFGAFSYRSVRRPDAELPAAPLRSRVPHYVEAEGLTLLALLLAAAALSAQPPAVDMGAQAASIAEVADMFAPRLPRVTSPPVTAVQNEQVDVLDAPGTPSPGDLWAEYNHNVAGLIVVALAVLAMLDRWGLRCARHWPLGFVGLALFMVFRNDPEAWPLGPRGFWESMGDGGILQHRLAVALACALGTLEWRARTARGAPRLPYVFPVLGFVGGILLLTHSHTAFETKSDFLLQIPHTGLGLLSIGVACGRLLELRLAPAGGRIAGLVSLTAMLLVGTLLVFYHEPRVGTDGVGRDVGERGAGYVATGPVITEGRQADRPRGFRAAIDADPTTPAGKGVWLGRSAMVSVKRVPGAHADSPSLPERDPTRWDRPTAACVERVRRNWSSRA